MHPLRLLLHFVVNVAAVALAAWILPGVAFDTLTALLLATLVLGVINALVRPVLRLVTLPINVLTLGLFGLVLNAVLVLVASRLVDGFEVAGFLWALAFSVVLAIVSGVLHLVERA